MLDLLRRFYYLVNLNNVEYTAHAKNKELVTARLAPDDKNRLEALADADRRPLSQFIRVILEEYLKGKK